MKINLEELNNLDPQNIGNWPLIAKVLVIVVLCITALGAGYYFDTQHQLAALEKVRGQESGLKRTFEQKQREAATLPKLKEQLAEIEKSLAEMRRSLPSSSEVSNLIQEISQTAIAAGLELELFKPQGKQAEAEYEKLPITIHLNGDYHSFGKFVSGVASMARIVTQHDVHITIEKNKDKKTQVETPLKMEMVARIYSYKDEDEAQPEDNKKKKK